LNEGLELIAGVSGCTLETEDLFNGLLSHNGISQAIGYVRELLLLSPLDVPLKALIVIVVMSVLSIGEGLLVVDLLSLGEPGASGLPPSVVEIEEHVVQVLVLITDRLDLVEVRGDVRHFVQILRTNLADVKIYHMAIVSVNFV
jgi:hypothetical protein